MELKENTEALNTSESELNMSHEPRYIIFDFETDGVDTPVRFAFPLDQAEYARYFHALLSGWDTVRNLTAPKESLPRFEYPLPNYFVYPNQIMAGHSSGVCWLFRHPSQESYIFHWVSSHDPSFENNIEQMLRIIRGHSHRLKTGVITETILHDGQMYYLIKPHGSFAEKLWITFGNRMDKYHIDLIMRVLTSIDPGHTHAEECAVLLQTLAHMNAKIEVDFFPEEEEGVSKLGTYVFSCEKMLLFSIDHSAVMWATDIGKIRHILLSMLALTCQHIPRKKKPLLESVSAG